MWKTQKVCGKSKGYMWIILKNMWKKQGVDVENSFLKICKICKIFVNFVKFVKNLLPRNFCNILAIIWQYLGNNFNIFVILVTFWQKNLTKGY